MSTQPERQSTKTISLRFFPDERRSVEAELLSPRIAVHQAVNRLGEPIGGWMVSDPVTGLGWLYTSQRFRNRNAAAKWVNRLKRKFGANPLSGGILDPQTAAWTRKPKNWKQISHFVHTSLAEGK